MITPHRNKGTAPAKRGVAAPKRVALAALRHAWIIAAMAFAPLLAGAQHWVGEKTLLTTLLLYLPQHPWGLPAACGLVACIWSRRWWAVPLCVGSLASWLILLMGWVPRTPAVFPRFPEPGTLRLLTYNVHMGLPDTAPIAQDLLNSHGDILLLQETTGPRGERDRDPLPALARAFPGWDMARTGEVALISRYPIHVQRQWPMPAPSNRSMLECLILTPQGPLTAFCVHVSTASAPRPDRGQSAASKHLKRLRGIGESASTRLNQLPAITNPVRSASGPWVMAGDFNNPPRGIFYTTLRHLGTDAFIAGGGGTGFSYPAGRPVMRIDYIFASPQIQVLRCKTGGRGGSDHRMVVADIALPARS